MCLVVEGAEPLLSMIYVKCIGRLSVHLKQMVPHDFFYAVFRIGNGMPPYAPAESVRHW